MSAPAPKHLIGRLQTLLFFFVLALGLASVHADGTWLHLRTGAWLSEMGRLPATDPFSYMAGAAPWRAHDWLADWVLYRLWTAGGAWLVVLAKAALIAAAFAALVPLSPGRPMLAAGTIALAACGAWPGFIETPACFDFLLVALLLRLLSGRTEYSVGLLWRTAGLSILWANLHPAGEWLAVALTAVAGFRRGMNAPRTQKVGWAAVVGVAVLAQCTNPHAGGAWAAADAAPEWTAGADLFNLHGLFLAAGVAAAWVCLQEDFVLVVSTMLLAALSVVRPAAAPLYLLAAGPLVTAGLGHFLEPVEPGRRRFAALGALLGLMLLSYVVHVSLPRGRVKGFTSRQTAEGALEFLEANRIGGRMFNDLASGAYLVWRAAPERPVFVDPRPGLYDAGVLEDARAWPSLWPTLASTYRFDYAVIENAGAGYPARAIDADRGWALAYFDDASLVYLRKAGPNDRVLKHGSFRCLRPNRWLDPVEEWAISEPAHHADVLEETLRALTYAPVSSTPPLVRAYVLQRLGDRRGAETMRRLARLRGFWKPEHRGLEGRILELGGNWEAAEKAYLAARTAAARAGSPLVASALDARLATAYAERGNLRKARSLARRAARLDPGNEKAAELLRKL
ncbi:MAG: hypothetical protein HY553_22265 [Elusimicrobia bacterium]|nr:hypothetical protein [Elusimicrobiota bacterium]